MIYGQILKLTGKSRLYIPQLILAHTKTCPTQHVQATSGCNTSASGPPKNLLPPFKRAMTSGKVRLGLIPEEWFTFFHGKTGVTGPYLFGIMVANYLVSKEIYVMEHEYYIGCSMLIMVWYVATTFGKDVGKWLDGEVDAFQKEWEKSRLDEMKDYENIIKNGKDSQWRAEGQKLLVDAKKEMVTVQLEAAYRERAAEVYRSVKARLDYHSKLHLAQRRIHGRWMIDWILENVNKSITPEFKKLALERAIQDISSMSDKTK